MPEAITVEVRPEHLQRAVALSRIYQDSGTSGVCLMNQALRDAFPTAPPNRKAYPPDRPDIFYSCGPRTWRLYRRNIHAQMICFQEYKIDNTGFDLVKTFDSSIGTMLREGPEIFPIALPVTIQLTKVTKEPKETVVSNEQL